MTMSIPAPFNTPPSSQPGGNSLQRRRRAIEQTIATLAEPRRESRPGGIGEEWRRGQTGNDDGPRVFELHPDNWDV